MTTINKLKNAWISNDTLINGTYGNVSFKNEGNTEVIGSTVLKNVGINKASSAYALDVSGNINCNGIITVVTPSSSSNDTTVATTSWINTKL